MNLFSTLLSNEKLIALLPQISLFAVFAAGKLGVVMPMLVSLINQPRFSKRQKTALSIALCLAASAIICLATGAFSGINWAASLVVLLSVTWGLYARFYKPSGIAPWFEQATELSKLVPVILAVFGVKATGALTTAEAQADSIDVPDAVPAPAATAPGTADASTDTATPDPATDPTLAS